MDLGLTDSESTSDLRLRIAALEENLEKAQTAREEAEADLATHQREAKNAEHAHHATRNLALYGHSDAIIFVQPEDSDEGLIYRTSKGKGTTATVCRVMVRYNIDQFLRPPRLHQWMHNGRLYREAGEQQSSRFELFFDLLFVGMVHQISEAAADLPTGIGFAKYILTFAPAFSIWADVRDIANQFANDDVTQRAYILWTMMLLVGYSNNASAVQLGEADTKHSLNLSDQSLTSMRWTLGFFVVAKLSRVILSLVYALFLPLSRNPLLISTFNPVVSTIIFFVAIYTSLRVTIALVATGIALDYLLKVVGVLLLKTMEVLGKKVEKKLRQKQMSKEKQMKHGYYPWTSAADETPAVAPTAEDPILTPGMEKDSRGPFGGAQTVNSSMTAVNETAPLGNIKVFQDAAAKGHYRFPAINIEHHVERLGAFVTIVLGEMVVGVFFAAAGPVGLNMESGRSLLGLMIAFNLNWMYFDSQACKHFIHAIRRHWFAGFLFTTLHLPLCMALLLASSAINRLVISDSIQSDAGGGLKWFFGAGLGISVWLMATLGVLHKNLDDEEGLTEHKPSKKIRRTINRKVVLSTRYVAGLVMTLVPLVNDVSSVGLLGIYVGITAFLIIEETFARIEKRELDLDKMASSGHASEANEHPEAVDDVIV
ncbi:hypothetical protein DFH07DRAFT_574338 [Mycena maculata]|uniref:Uncharacterized protein n=1 Tax=Mycena maculata TaxID=230809 RepID=A0AAD7ISD1_9AGAR|nr:hypothetical protein DFH07DRAFT_574338 [Mycena maculata]